MRGPHLPCSRIADLLEWQAERIPDRTAIVHREHTHTWASLNAEANRFAQWLCDAGVRRGDRVILYAANGPRLVAALFGAVKIGAVFVPVHPKTPPTRLSYILHDCDPAVVIADFELSPGLSKRFNRPILLTSDVFPDKESGTATVASWGAPGSRQHHLPGVDVSPDDLAAIIYTSGSTKEPKGVMLPHRQVVFATSSINAVLENGAEDVILCGLPLSFDYGLYQIFLAFQAGAKLVLERDFVLPMVIPRLLSEHKVTGFPGVPSLFAMLLRSGLLARAQFPSLRYVTSTADVFPPAHIQRLRELLPHVTIFPMYGLTECKRVSIVPRGQLAGHESSVGLPLPGTQVSVVDEAGREVDPGTVGQLVVRGPHVMAGYWNDPEETSRRFRRDDSTGEILLYTGDIFWRGEDGFLYFVGRDETFIKSRGQKVSLVEVGSVLCEIEGVAEAAAVGIPDPTSGEAVVVFVSPVKSGAVSARDVAERCQCSLPPAARPSHIVVLESPLPKTVNGKVDRARLQSMAVRDIALEGQASR